MLSVLHPFFYFCVFFLLNLFEIHFQSAVKFYYLAYDIFLIFFFFLQNNIAAKITSLLSLTNPALNGKEEPLHAILHNHFELQGNPLHRQLFNITPPCFVGPKGREEIVFLENQTHNTSLGSAKPGLLSSVGISHLDNILFGVPSAGAASGTPAQPSATANQNNNNNNNNNSNQQGKCWFVDWKFQLYFILAFQ